VVVAAVVVVVVEASVAEDVVVVEVVAVGEARVADRVAPSDPGNGRGPMMRCSAHDATRV